MADMLWNFVGESNHIEGIFETTEEQVEATREFLALDELTVTAVERLVHVYQPDAELRDQVGLNVRVGNHIAPPGGPSIREALASFLHRVNTDSIEVWAAHVEYETLHPFTDGNGRSGRAIWAWQFRDLSLGFLHRFYYQSLENARILI